MVGCEAIIDGLKKLIANVRANCGIVGWIEPYYISASGSFRFGRLRVVL